MTDHTHLREMLAYYRDLDPGKRQTVDAHLAGCAQCRDVLAAYDRQDTRLGALPGLAARRAWRPPEKRAAPQMLGRLGDVLVLAGGGALAWLLVLQVRMAAVPVAGTGGPPGAPAAPLEEPGLTIPPATLRPPSAWQDALPWVAAALLLIGVLFILSRRSRWPPLAGALVSALLLTSFVPPLSAVPNLAGLYWRLVGGYSYDPDLPFKNDFLIAGRPEAQLQAHLDDLIGQVGLAPLDPTQPLESYEFVRVGLHPAHNRVALVFTRFIYAGGTSRVYPVPLLGPVPGFDGLWLAGWREDGLERLRSQHLALPGQPFAGPTSPLRLGPARRLELTQQANRLDEVNPAHWLWNSVRVQHLVWSPDATQFLAVFEDGAQRQLWRVPLDGSAPVQVASDYVVEYGWSPDGQVVVYTRYDSAASQVNPKQPFAIMAAGLQPRAVPVSLVTGLTSSQLPGLTREGAWFFSGGALWIVPYAGGQPAVVARDLGFALGSAPRPTPGGDVVAFACGVNLCLLPRPIAGAAAEVMTIGGVRAAEAAWSPDADSLAVIDRDPNGLSSVALTVVTRHGEVVLEADIAPRDVTEAPQWTPDGQAIFIQTYPQDGRRIIAVYLPTASVLDLSQEHWDAYFALSPDGRTLLLNNGRGDFWLADVLR